MIRQVHVLLLIIIQLGIGVFCPVRVLLDRGKYIYGKIQVFKGLLTILKLILAQ